MKEAPMRFWRRCFYSVLALLSFIVFLCAAGDVVSLCWLVIYIFLVFPFVLIGSNTQSGSNMAALSDTRTAAVVVRNSPFHLFDVTGNIHLFRSLM